MMNMYKGLNTQFNLSKSSCVPTNQNENLAIEYTGSREVLPVVGVVCMCWVWGRGGASAWCINAFEPPARGCTGGGTRVVRTQELEEEAVVVLTSIDRPLAACNGRRRKGRRLLTLDGAGWSSQS